LKINIASILVAHVQTLYDARSDKIAKADIFVFYALPLLLALGAWWFGLRLKADHYNASITFFGIFLALLLNIQVAIFSIFQRKWASPSDTIKAEAQSLELADRRKLLGELNVNLSYLTVVSCISLAIFMPLYIFEIKANLAACVTTFLYAHFLLTFLMIIKRSYALFQKEYRDGTEY
jgi:hypothetical protein